MTAMRRNDDDLDRDGYQMPRFSLTRPDAPAAQFTEADWRWIESALTEFLGVPIALYDRWENVPGA
jgi:hypothetical protein